MRRTRTSLSGWLICAVTLAMCPGGSARAGAPAGWTSGMEGQWGIGPVVWSPDARHIAATGWDRAGLVVLELATGKVIMASQERGAGFQPVWHDRQIYFKEVVEHDGERQHSIVRYDLASGLRQVLHTGVRLGQPSLASGRMVWTDDRTLSIASLGATPTILARIPLPGYCNLAVLAPDGRRVAFSHPDGRMGILDLGALDLGTLDLGAWDSDAAADVMAATMWVTGPGAYSHPEWSPDGRMLLIRGPGALEPGLPGFTIVAAHDGAVLGHVQGTHPSWLTGATGATDGRVLFERIQAEPFRVLGSELWIADAVAGTAVPITDTQLNERYAALSPGGRVMAFVDTISGDLHLAGFRGDQVSRSSQAVLGEWQLPKVAPRPTATRDAIVIDDVPYMHQLWDTPDNFNGNWSCGPTSCMQSIQRYGRLPDHNITCSWPYAHTSPWGWYIPNRYSYNGYTYDTPGLAAGDAWVEGAHGFICLELGGAWYNQMVAFVNQHGLFSEWGGTSFDTLVAEVDAGYTMYASTTVLGAGHIIVMKGYAPDHSIVVNDPYGDAGSGDWGNYDGEGVVYDWPGYNNGNLEIEVGQVFPARGPVWDAEFLVQHFPVNMRAGERAAASVELRNTGSQMWGGPGVGSVRVHLGTADPVGRTSSFQDVTWPSAQFPASLAQDVPAGGVGRFELMLHAPQVAQVTVFEERFGLVNDAGSWFGVAAGSILYTITVTPCDNQPPVADAGSDQSIALGGAVILDGGGSTDADGQLVEYLWHTPNGDFTGQQVAWSPGQVGLHQVQLVVTDDLGDSDTDMAVVHVFDATDNLPPIADAGSDHVVQLGEPVHLDGSGSSDPDGGLVLYRWEIPFGERFGNRVDWMPINPGVSLIRLTVMDDGGLIATDMLQVTVLDPDLDGTSDGEQQPPAEPLCGCGPSGSTGLAWLAVAAILLAVVRRRRISLHSGIDSRVRSE